jgi:hypothetical protein
MTDKTSSGIGKQGHVQLPELDTVRGYQPQVPGPVNLATLKPPRGGTAIVRPEKPPANK